MSWLEQDRPNGPFQLVARVGDRRLKRSTRTTDERAAQEFVLRVDRRLALIETGELDVPEDVDVLTFAMSDGPVARKQDRCCHRLLADARRNRIASASDDRADR